jgi:hypothetical protein
MTRKVKRAPTGAAARGARAEAPAGPPLQVKLSPAERRAAEDILGAGETMSSLIRTGLEILRELHPHLQGQPYLEFVRGLLRGPDQVAARDRARAAAADLVRIALDEHDRVAALVTELEDAARERALEPCEDRILRLLAPTHDRTRAPAPAPPPSGRLKRGR